MAAITEAAPCIILRILHYKQRNWLRAGYTHNMQNVDLESRGKNQKPDPNVFTENIHKHNCSFLFRICYNDPNDQ